MGESAHADRLHGKGPAGLGAGLRYSAKEVAWLPGLLPQSSTAPGGVAVGESEKAPPGYP